MKRNIKILSLLLAVLLAFSVFPVNTVYAVENTENTYEPDTYIPEEEYTEEIYEGTGSLEYAFDGTFIRDYVDNETLDEAGHVARINEEEALNTYVFLNRDGTKSVYYMDDNVRYVDENGETVEKDLTIIRKNKGYTLKANDVKLWFPDVLSDGISVKYDKYHLTLYPQGVADTEEVIIDEYGRLTYPGVFGENTVLAYTPTLSGLKEDIILSEYTGQLSYDFLIHTHGMRILEEDGKYIVKKPGNGNKETFELGAVQIYDSAGNFCVGEMKITEQNNGSKYILTLIAPEEFLTDPDTVYPVTIDPTLEVSDNLNGANSIEDSVIYSGTPNSNYGGFTYLTVGYGDSTYGVGRAIFRLPGLYNSDLYNSLSASQITSVKFYTWDASGHDNLPIEILANVNIPWTESGVKWNNAPGGYPGLSPVTAYMPSGNFACFDITSIVEWWKAGNSPAGGFTMKNPNETNDIYKKVPCSSETAITDRRPYVVMTYTTTLTITPNTNYLPGGAYLEFDVWCDETIQSVEWSTDNSTVAPISETGLVYGNSVGRAMITAKVTFTDGSTQTVQREIYVIFPYNVIRIQNKNSSKYLNVDQGRINDLAQVTQYSSTSDAETTQEEFQQVWKIKYIGDGMYTLRPYHKLDMCLYAYGPNNYVRIRPNTKDGSTNSADPNYVIAAYRWSIEYLNGGYVIKRNGAEEATLQIENSSTALNAQARVQAYADSNNCRWTFSIITNPESGVILYDTENQQQIVCNENNEYDISLYIAPKEVKTIADLGLLPVMYSPTKIDQTFSFTIDTSHILYNQETKCFTGVSAGTFDLTGTTSNFSTNNTFTVSMTTTLVPNGVYYLRNWEQDLYASIEDGALESGTAISQEYFTAESIKQWKITRYKDDYYIIQSEQANAYHIGVSGSSTSENICITSCSDEVPSGLQWKFSKTASGAVKITSKLGESLGRVIAVGSDETHIKHITYTADSNYMDEWLLSKVTTIEDMVLIPQEGAMWCWAAAAKMASYAYMETPFSVGALVWYKDRGERVLDVDANQKNVTDDVGATAGKTEEILAYILGTESMHMTYSYGNSVYSPAALQNMLDQGYPVIVCWNYYLENTQEKVGEHAIVVYGYDWSSEKNDYVYSVYNPSPKECGTQETLTYAQLYMGQRYVPRIGTNEQVLVDCYWTDMVVFKADGYNDVSDCPLPTTD